jgi:hypothetical protein
MAREYIYPAQLAGANVPFMRITANRYKYGGSGEPQGHVTLYHPPGVSFSDGAGYGTMDMGPIGNKLMEAIQDPSKSGVEIAREANSQINGKGSDADLRSMMSLKIAKDSGLGNLVPGVENLSDMYGMSKGVATNPNTVVAFQNMTIRSFNFSFSLVAEDPSESQEIRKIQEFFRSEMYPEQGAGSYLLTYPSTFSIKFYTQDGRENPYYPRIYECNLTNLQTNFNDNAHMHFDGGAPISVNISLTFQETKVLTKSDIGTEER